MKVMTTVEIPAHTESIVDHHVCDLCRRRIKDGGNYDVEEVGVQARTGTCFPEGGSTVTEEFDVCLSCWRSKVVPWFASHGAVPSVTEFDY